MHCVIARLLQPARRRRRQLLPVRQIAGRPAGQTFSRHSYAFWSPPTVAAATAATAIAPVTPCPLPPPSLLLPKRLHNCRPHVREPRPARQKGADGQTDRQTHCCISRNREPDIGLPPPPIFSFRPSFLPPACLWLLRFCLARENARAAAAISPFTAPQGVTERKSVSGGRVSMALCFPSPLSRFSAPNPSASRRRLTVRLSLEKLYKVFLQNAMEDIFWTYFLHFAASLQCVLYLLVQLAAKSLITASSSKRDLARKSDSCAPFDRCML